MSDAIRALEREGIFEVEQEPRSIDARHLLACQDMNLSNEAPRPSMEHYPNIEQQRSTLLAILARTGTPMFLCERENLH